jgi:two-component system, NtrC family, sensor kinase
MRNSARNDSLAWKTVLRSTDGSSQGGVRLPEMESRDEAMLGTLLDSVGCGILLFGLSGELWAVNDRFAEILGNEPLRLRGLNHFDQFVASLSPQFVHGEVVAARWRQRRQNGEASWDELELANPEKKLLERYARPVLNRYRQPLGWLEIYHDISIKRHLESRLFHSERLAALGQMVCGVVHELNNPLTSILGYAQIVRKRARGFPWEAEARHILEEAKRARHIARNLLLFTRDNNVERTSVSLNEIVERTVAIRAHELRLEDIRAEMDLDERLPRTIADAVQIQQVLLNLIVNAEQAIQQFRGSGHIWIRTRQVSVDRVVLEVADNGPGVPPEVVQRIFDPFFTTKPVGAGTGLGLSIVYGIVHQHGGEVAVENRPAGGAVFRIELPSMTPMENAGEKPYVVGMPAPELPTDGNRVQIGRILVVEDEPTVACLIADVLGDVGHMVDTVLDSRKGLGMARRGQYDLVICDLRMPHLDGRSFYRELLREQSSMAQRLIFVTGDTLAPRTVDFLQRCSLRYLAKPFLVEELKEIVRLALEGSTDGRYSVIGTTGGESERDYEQPPQHDRKRHER